MTQDNTPSPWIDRSIFKTQLLHGKKSGSSEKGRIEKMSPRAVRKRIVRVWNHSSLQSSPALKVALGGGGVFLRHLRYTEYVLRSRDQFIVSSAVQSRRGGLLRAFLSDARMRSKGALRLAE